MTLEPKNIALDKRKPGSAVGVVEHQGRRVFAAATGTVDGTRAVLLVGGTSYWVPEAQVTFA